MTTTAETKLEKSGWRETFAVYLKPRVLIVLFLGFSAGLPLALSGSTLLVWMREAGVERYTIYQWGELVFSHLEVPSYAALVERFNGDPVAQRWEEEMGDVLEYPNADPETGWPERLAEVWSL